MKPVSLVLFLIALVVAASPATLTPFRARLPPRPRLPPMPPLPPVPQLPPPPSSRSGALGAPSSPPDCFIPLYNMFSCLDFLTITNISNNQAPTAQCCDGFRAAVNSSAIICLCHVVDRDLGSFTNRPPINMFHAILLPVQCGVVLPLRTFTMCSFEPIPPIHPDNSSAPPPASISGGTAKVGLGHH